MKNKILIVSCCVLVLLATACGKSVPKLQNGEEIVASITGKDFTAEDLYEVLKSNYGYSELINMIDMYIADQEIETTDEITEYAQEVVDYYMSYAELYGVDLETFLTSFVGLSGISTEEEFLEFVIADYKITLAIQKYIQENLTEEEIENYYNENYSEKLTVRHILIEVEESDTDGSKALATANEIIEKLNATSAEDLEDTFIELAAEYSDDGTYNTGGLISDFMSSSVVSEFWNASYALKDGEYTKTPVLTTYGYHIILRESSSDAPTLEESLEDVKVALAEEKISNDATLQYTAMVELRKKYNLTINDSDLKTLYNDFVASLES